MAAIFAADVYCDDCADDIRERIAADLWSGRVSSIAPDGTPVSEFETFEDFADHLDCMDERTYDSDNYPKGCDDDETSDTPQHCGSHADCLNPTVLNDGSKVGHFFENNLTAAGDEYVSSTVLEDLEAGRKDSVAVEVWMPYYDYIEYPGYDEDGNPVVDFDDIEQKVEYDDCHYETPWESCDGWEHEFVRESYYDHDDRKEHYSYVNRSNRDGGSGYIVVDDADVIKWGCTGPSGCSKQVRFEAIAAAKRKATEQLVKWYENGWNWYTAIAEYEDYSHCVGGIDCEDYAEEVARECAMEVVDELERDGYTVINQPEPPKPYNKVDSFRSRIRYNLTGVWV